MKKITTGIFILLVGAFIPTHASAATSIKEQIVVVRPDIPEAQKKYVKEMSSILYDMKYYDAGDTYKKLELGWFGSGFIIKGKDGKNYILTNKHVTRGTGKVKVEFMEASKPVTYNACPVIKECEDIDLAIIEIPQEHPVENALEISQEAIIEGNDVWTAGYPGLSDNPTWQLGKGIISNMKVKNETFGDEEKIYVIQHTAQVDAGNSGGPLMLRKGGKDGQANYTVIGINTWKAGGRENTNFAIPSKFILEFIEQATSNKNEQAGSSKQDEEIEQAAIEFIKALNSAEEEKITPYIADEYLYDINKSSLEQLLDNASSVTRMKAKGFLQDAEGEKAIKALLTEYFLKRMRKNDEPLKLESSNIEEDGVHATTTYRKKNEKMAFNWKKEDGKWEIISSTLSDFSAMKSGGTSLKESTGRVHILDLDDRCIRFSAQIGTSEYAGHTIEMMYINYFANYAMLGFCFGGGKNKYPEYYYTDDYEEYTMPSDLQTSIYLGYNMGAGLPIGFGKVFTVTPYVLPGIGINFTRDYYAELRGGVRFGWRYKKYYQVHVGVEALSKIFIYDFEKDCNRKYIGIALGWDF